MVYIDVMKDIMSSYNDRRHRMIRMSPNQAEHLENGDAVRASMSIYYKKFDDAANRRKKRKLKPRFAAGDWVRVQKTRSKFFRSFHETYGRTVYQVAEALTNLPSVMYTLRDLDGLLMDDKYYQSELQAVALMPFKIAHVFRNRRRQNPTTGEREYLVRWEGLPDSHNSYVPQREITQ